MKTTLLPNCTLPLADWTVWSTGGICAVWAALLAGGVREEGGTVHNTEVYDETEAVLEAIYRACQERKAPSPQPLSP